MKKLGLFSLVAFSGMMGSAQAVPYQFYLGTDAVYSINSTQSDDGAHLKLNNPSFEFTEEYPSSLPAAVINAGFNFSENFGVEVFYQASGHEKNTYTGVHAYNETLSAETSFQAYGADMIAYIRGTDKVDWLLSAGLAQYKYETEFKYRMNGGITDRKTVEEDGIGARLGAGFQINFNDYVSFRAMYRYIFADIPGINNSQEILIGVRIGFSPFFYDY